MISLYDALIIVGHADDQPFATKLCQWLQDYGFSAWPLTSEWTALGQPLRPEPRGLDRIISAAHNLVILASDRGYTPQAIQAIGRGLTYHKRLILVHPLGPTTPESGQGGEASSAKAKDALVEQLKQHLPPWPEPWLFEVEFPTAGPTPLIPALRRLGAVLRDRSLQVRLHTQILVKALAWQRHYRPPADLLSGTALLQATQWLREGVDDTYPACQPTLLQCEFIAESAKYANDLVASVFLAYDDADRSLTLGSQGTSAVEAVRQLLLRSGFTLWDHRYDYQPHTDLETAISRATEACDNYVILLSPNAIHNTACLQGLLFALSMNKRIVPVLLATVVAAHLPDPLQGMEWVDLRGATLPLTQSAGGRQLIQILRHEADFHHTHTQLLMDALCWERQYRHPSGLLPRRQLSQYQRWLRLAQRHPRYQPLHLQELFLSESRRQGTHPPGLVGSPLGVMHWLKHWMSS